MLLLCLSSIVREEKRARRAQEANYCICSHGQTRTKYCVPESQMLIGEGVSQKASYHILKFYTKEGETQQMFTMVIHIMFHLTGSIIFKKK